MGLLDEAIREHLDLRRRHGADPAEVAREELDALAPVERDQRPERGSGSAEVWANDEAAIEIGGRGAPFEGHRGRITGGDAEGGDGPSRSREVSFMEATAEIDMRAVLGELEDALSSEEAGGDARVRRGIRAESATPVAAGSSRSAFDFEVDEDPLAWETPAPRVRRIEGRGSERAARGEWSPEAQGS